jgi:hypothetical protein
MTAVMPEQEISEDSKPFDGVDTAVQALNGDDDDDNGVTEIESLCMNCHDDVRITDTPVVVQF